MSMGSRQGGIDSYAPGLSGPGQEYFAGWPGHIPTYGRALKDAQRWHSHRRALVLLWQIDTY